MSDINQMIPMVRTRKEVERIVEDSRFSPLGFARIKPDSANIRMDTCAIPVIRAGKEHNDQRSFMDIRVTRARRIFSDGRHNAFTSICSFKGKHYVAFRNGETHISYDGAIKLLSSANLEDWSQVAVLSVKKGELRDPKLAVFNGKLLVYAGQRFEDTEMRESLVFTSSDGMTFSQERLSGLDGLWLWSIHPFKDRLFGTAYKSVGDGAYQVKLYDSADGSSWSRLLEFPVDGNETFIDIDDNGTVYALSRDESHGSCPTLYTIQAPYKSASSYKTLPVRLQGPMVKRLDGGCLIAGRNWDGAERRNLRTDLHFMHDSGDIEFICSLPSGGDCSYAGWIWTGDRRAALSYYSAHEHKMDAPHDLDKTAGDPAFAEHSSAADIFLADISLPAPHQKG